MSVIVNGASYRCTWWWSKHFSDDQENVRTTIVQSNGLASESFQDMMREMHAMALASGTRAQNYMWICDISPRPDKYVTEEERDRMRQIIEERRGLKGDVYFMIEQEKADGRKHFHLVELRIDLETGRAVPDSKDAKICHAAARQICEELGWERTISPFDKDRDGPRPERAPERWEMYRGMKSGIDPRDIQAEVTDLFHQSDSGPAFKAALEDHGYQLVTGRRGLLILDVAGNEHSLARRIEGVTTKELNAFMRDVDRAALPTLEQGKAIHQERKIAALEADRATVKQEIEWEEALAKAAIGKEKIEERFIAPEDREKTAHVDSVTGHRDASPAREDTGREETKRFVPDRELNDLQGDIRLAFSLSQSAAGFIQNLEELAARELSWEEYRPGRFRPVGDRVFCVARVTQEEALSSQIDSYYAKNFTVTDADRHGQRTIDNPEYVPVYREGDYVVLTERGQAYSLYRATDRSRDEVEKFMATLDPGSVLTLTEARQSLEETFKVREAEYQAFRGFNALGSLNEGVSAHDLKQAAIDVKQEAAGVISAAGSVAEHTAQTIELGAKLAGPVLETVANIAGEAIEMLGDMFGATAMTPERVQAAIDARKRAAEQREIEHEWLRKDAENRRQAEAREKQRREEEEARRSYEQDKERGWER
jgi:hypothetical protein